MEKFRYAQDFEDKDPVEFWTSNGEHEVNFKGITDEKAFSGKKSFKLDVTLKSGNYHYWSAPVRVPSEGKLKFSGRILVAEPTNARVGLGANFVFPPSHHSGCGGTDTIGEPTGEWKLQEIDLVERGMNCADGVIRRHTSEATGDNVGVFLDRWGIFIRGGKGKRVVVYIDDVKIEGEVPRIDRYEDEIRRRWQPAKEKFLEHV